MLYMHVRRKQFPINVLLIRCFPEDWCEIWAVKANPVKAGSSLLNVTSHSGRHECKQMYYCNHLIMLCCVLLQLFNTIICTEA